MTILSPNLQQITTLGSHRALHLLFPLTLPHFLIPYNCKFNKHKSGVILSFCFAGIFLIRYGTIFEGLQQIQNVPRASKSEQCVREFLANFPKFVDSSKTRPTPKTWNPYAASSSSHFASPNSRLKMESLNLIQHSPPSTANYFNRGLSPTISRVSALPRTSNRKIIHHFTDNKQESELFKLKSMWVQLINSSYQPVGIEIISSLMNYYVKVGEFDEIDRVVCESVARGFASESVIYFSAVSCFGEVGNLRMMKRMIELMVLRCVKIDSLIGNVYIKYYAMFGSLEEMEAAYHRIKSLRILIDKEAIREVARAYISEKKFYKLSEFLRDVGLRRRNAGNLLWNLLLLSYAANFKMKSVQREFLNMVECGFSPDLTTFNVRALAFSRMGMFWDLHLSIKHMKHKGIDPDLVTYGCIVDLYLDRRLGRNLSFALGELDVGRLPVVATDPLVFEGFGKGDFHSTAEVILESTMGTEWSYSKLVRMYLKKKYRSSQIFWNY